MWTYEQLTGRLFDPAGKWIATGYAGGGTDPTDTEAIKGKNNPDMQDRHNIGPLPRGMYTIKAPINTVTHGPYVMELVPDITNEMFGRDAFRMHGDSVIYPGFASDGCPVQNHPARVKVWESGDVRFQVVG